MNRPTGVAVDKEGIIYVTDWGNDRLQVFDRDGRFISKMAGDATMSKWGKQKLDANPDNQFFFRTIEDQANEIDNVVKQINAELEKEQK